MKIKLTEEQYNRLLVENEKDFLDGDVNFKHIGNKVTPFIVKLFNIIAKKSEMTWDAQVRMIKNDFSLTEAEAVLLTYNFNNFKAQKGITDDFSSVLGEPLVYYGRFIFDTEVPVFGTVSGYIDGYAEAYATSYEEFLEQLQNGDVEVVADWNNRVDSYDHDTDWEVDHDYAQDRVSDNTIDFDEEELDDFKDRVTIG